jgi:DNA-directed RNA polymerase specialized sigma24 family protein
MATLVTPSQTEVAARMGRSVDSVEKLWVRALARLRRRLGGET